MRIAALFVFFLVILGCSEGDKRFDTVQEDSRFDIVDGSIIAGLDMALNEKDADVVILEDNIVMSLGERANIFYAVRNPKNLTDICIYTQFTCKTVLKGDNCDTELNDRNSAYFWKWFRPANKKLVKNMTTAYLQAEISEDNRENVFLGEMTIWYMDAKGPDCPEIDQFSERSGIKRYGKAGFVLNVG